MGVPADVSHRVSLSSQEVEEPVHRAGHVVELSCAVTTNSTDEMPTKTKSDLKALEGQEGE